MMKTMKTIIFLFVMFFTSLSFSQISITVSSNSVQKIYRPNSVITYKIYHSYVSRTNCTYLERDFDVHVISNSMVFYISNMDISKVNYFTVVFCENGKDIGYSNELVWNSDKYNEQMQSYRIVYSKDVGR